MNDPRHEPIVVTPEVLPPEPDGQGGYRARPGPEPGPDRGPGRLNMVMIGLLLDALDYLTRGTLGIRVGLPLGFVVAFLLLRMAGIPLKQRLLYSLCAGVYCLVPGTERFPLGTVLGALLKLR